MKAIIHPETEETLAIYCEFHQGWEILSSYWSVVTLVRSDYCVLELVHSAMPQHDLIKFKAILLDKILCNILSDSTARTELASYLQWNKDKQSPVRFESQSDVLAYLVSKGLYPTDNMITLGVNEDGTN